MPRPEPRLRSITRRVITTDDGYTFWAQDDGTWTDHVDPDMADMVYNNERELRSAMGQRHLLRRMTRKELVKLIVAAPSGSGGYRIRHDLPGEAIVCEVPTLEMAGTIVAALRERALKRMAAGMLGVPTNPRIKWRNIKNAPPKGR